MRAREFLNETGLTLGKITKYPDRPEIFLNLIKNKHTFQSKHGPVQIDPTEIPRLAKIFSGETTMMVRSIMVKTLQGKTMSTGDIEYNDADFGGKSKSGDTSLKLKPKHVFPYKDKEQGSEQDLTPELAINLGGIQAKDLYERIQSSDHLSSQQGPGQAIKMMSAQIHKKQIPTIPTDLGLVNKQLSSIVNDGFEYLGVQALVEGVIKFDNRDEFYQHVGVSPSDMLLVFPGETNNPLADSYALTNNKTGNKIYLSSKGGQKGTGAPSSINEVKIPDHMLKTYKNDESLQFIKHIQQFNKANNASTYKQAFEAAKFIANSNPGTLGALEPFVHLFDDKFYAWTESYLRNKKKKVPSTIEEIPSEYQDLYNLVQKSISGNKPLFYLLKNCVKDKFVAPAINSSKAIPQFSARMIEILGHNFVLITSAPKPKMQVGAQIISSATWPHKVGGKVSIDPKDEADKWGAAMSWKLTPN